MSSLIKSTAIVDKHYLAMRIAEEMDSKLEEADVTVRGFEIKIKRVGDIQISAVAKSILIKLPLDITMTKPEGIFSIEGHGAVLLDVRMDIDISQDWDIVTITQLQEYTWLIDPRVKVGSINIPLESIVDKAIASKEDDITDQLDATIKKHLNLQAIVAEQAKRLSDGIEVYDGLLLTGILVSMQVSHFKEEGNKIYMHCVPSLELLVRPRSIHRAATIAKMPDLLWMYDMPKTTQHMQEVLLELSYDFIAEQLRRAIDDLVVGGKDLDVQSVSIAYTDELEISIQVKTPVDASIMVTGRPSYDLDTGAVDLVDLDVKVSPNNIIYKLSAPIINRIIENRMQDMLPVKINTLINQAWQEQRQKLPQIEDIRYTIDIDKLRVGKMTFLADKALASIEVIRPEVEVMIG